MGENKGYRPSEVSTAINKINSAYNLISVALVDKNHGSFVLPMSSKWGSPQAVRYFGSYKTTIDSLCSEVTKVFTSIVNSMNSAATSLATIAEDSWSTMPFEASTKQLDVSCIKEKLPDGTIGVDVEAATGYLSQLDSVLSVVDTGLDSAVSAVGTSGFIGGGMQDSLVGSLNKIKSNIDEAFNKIKSDVVEAINNTAQNYNTTTTNVSNAFNGGEG